QRDRLPAPRLVSPALGTCLTQASSLSQASSVNPEDLVALASIVHANSPISATAAKFSNWIPAGGLIPARR
ncbi:MAG: hypothetical protein WD005_06655, partial [Haliea sp.]